MDDRVSPFSAVKTRDKVIIGVVGACVAVAAGIWMEVRRGHRMRAAVEQALEMNSTFQTFTSDTIYLDGDSSNAVTLRDAVAYYDHPVRRFLFRNFSFFSFRFSLTKSLYALGCVYRDLHEAPIAIITWEDAVAAADTTAADCDYATLYRVYGQMADIFRNQHLPEKQLEADSLFSKYALLAGDTLISIRGKLLCNAAYYTLGDTAAIFANSEAVRQQYLKLGRVQEAAQVYPTPIHVAVEAGQYARAHQMMDEYEHYSGLFDEQGNIIDPSRAQYYLYKGLYYLGIDEIDSAEWQFQKLLQDSIHFIDACRGLFTLYHNIHDADSAFKYGRLYEEAMGRFLDNQNGDAIIQALAMYDYHRQEGIAEKEHLKNRRIMGILVLICILAVFTFVYSRKRMKSKAAAMQRLTMAFSQKEEDLENAKAELRYLKNHLQDMEGSTHLPGDEDSSQLIARLEERIGQMKEQLKHDARILGKLEVIEREERLMSDDVVLLFQRICHPHMEESGKKPERKARVDEWDALRRTIKKEHLSFFIAIEEHDLLTDHEKKVALLSRIDLQTQEMAVIIGCPPQSISNARAGISAKLFHSDETYKVSKKLKDL